MSTRTNIHVIDFGLQVGNERSGMNWRKVIPAGVFVCTVMVVYMTTWHGQRPATGSASSVVTDDIQAGIESHIDEQTRLGSGYFTLPFDDGQLRLKLVRVHTEYLANLDPRRHFACVDLASTDGRWWPIDISEADKCSSLATYYFGHHPANRVEFSRGRDLVVEPGPASGPINFLAYPVLEIGGKPARAKVEFSFIRPAVAAR